MAQRRTRRTFIRDMGIGAAVLPVDLQPPPSLGFVNHGRRKRRLVSVFSPNGVIPSTLLSMTMG